MILNKRILTLFLLVSVANVYAQKKSNNDSSEKKSSSSGSEKVAMAGTWQGILTQPGGSLADNYAFWISFKQTKDSIHGLSRLEINNTNNFGILEFKGIIKGDTVFVQETKITDKNLQRGAFWCIKAYKLFYNKNDKSLTGDWIAPKGCGPGKIYLYKSTLEFNHNDAHTNIYMSYDDFKTNIKAGTSVKTKKVVMTDIVFEESKTDLQEPGKKYLDDLVVFLKANTKVSIKILGHTDIVGDDFPNFTLSVQRAKAIVDYMISKGIKATRLQYEGFGEARPMRDNSTENGRMKNRRMEFEVVD